MANIRRSLKKFVPHLLKARDDNFNEADTVRLIIKVFEEVLDYDPLTEITSEAQIQNKYVDLALKIDGVIRLLVEAKAAAVELRDRHLDQAKHYAAEGNHAWVLLTNGVTWTLYHLSLNEGVEYVKAFSVDLDSDPFDEAAEQIARLHRQSIAKGVLEAYWQHRSALRPESIGRAIFTDETLRLIRREIRRHENILIDEEDLARAIHEMFSTETREQIGTLKIKRKRKKRTVAAGDVQAVPSAESPPPSQPEAGVATAPASNSPSESPTKTS